MPLVIDIFCWNWDKQPKIEIELEIEKGNEPRFSRLQNKNAFLERGSRLLY
jgi:hypothetical protein